MGSLGIVGAKRQFLLGFMIVLSVALSCVLGCAGQKPRALERSIDPDAWRFEQARRATGLDTPARVADTHVVLLMIDGVRWQDVFRGVDRALARKHGLSAREHVSAAALMPNLHGIIARRGVALGAPRQGAIAASGPNFVSVPGYMEAFTGRKPHCRANDCPTITEPTLVDEFAAVPGARLGDVAVFASWPGIEKAASFAPAHIVMSVGRTHGTNHDVIRGSAQGARLLLAGTKAGPGPGGGDFRRDAATAHLALHYLRERRPRFLFLGLGEPDEYGHHDDYGSYLRSLRSADSVIGEVDRALAELAASGRQTLLIVATDHGRSAGFRHHGAAHPESARVWLVASGTLVTARGYPAMPFGARRLSDIAPTIRSLSHLPADRSSGAGRVLNEVFLAGAMEQEKYALE
ncbi:MAG TPA: hypothetical protein VI072_24640 [Polyangiaceae bacterium]